VSESNASAPSNEEAKKSGPNVLLIVLAVALGIAVIAIIVLLALTVFGGDGQPQPEVPPGVTLVPTRPIATPKPGEPTGVVIAPSGVNVRTGPGTLYPIMMTAPFGMSGKIVGISPDRTWWVFEAPNAPDGVAWAAAEYIRAENAGSVPVVQPPPVPTALPPSATATPTQPPAPNINFTVNRSTINAGEAATLQWSVENVKAVYVFPVGANAFDYPVQGQGSRDVRPMITTSYELRVVNPDDSTTSHRLEIAVVGGLTGGRWVLQSYSSPSTGSKTVLPGTQVTARFSPDGSLSGSGGCNSYNGGFTAFEQTLRVTTLTASAAICSDPAGIMEQEQMVLSLLQQASRMSISAGQLEVFRADGSRSLVFVTG
jgi:heat shock protein HslJ